MATTHIASRSSFGGRAGTLFRKRKSHDVVLKSKKSKKAPPAAPTERPSTGSTSILIGWDDVKCRPIYLQAPPAKDEKTPHEATPTSRPSSNDEPRPTNIRLNFSSTKKASNNSNANTHTIVRATDGPEKKKTKSYGRARQQRNVCDMDLDGDDHGGNFEDQQRIATTLTEQFEIEGNEKEEEYDDHTQTASFDATTFARRVSSGSYQGGENDNNKDTVFDFQDDDAQKDDKPPMTICETPRSSSLRVAREFFEKLDRDHQLTIAAEPSTCPRRRRHETTGRSTFGSKSKKHLSSIATKLNEEYKDYTAACKESAVTPISKDTYAHNRSLFFQSEIDDSFLDG